MRIPAKFLPGLTLVVFCGLSFAGLGCGGGKASDEAVTPEAFLARHWDRPLEPQGPPPTHFTPPEASLDPAVCGSCHPDQFQDWSGSLHSRAMSPGLMGQLVEMDSQDRASLEGCTSCHAPLHEQAESLVGILSDLEAISDSAAIPATALSVFLETSSSLHGRGIMCAACHVRGRRVFGPPRRPDLPPFPEGLQLPHDGWESRVEFEDSRFCAACHQFEPEDLSIAGKLLENTYEEWRVSRFAEEGKSCQSCHMPERRHLFLGIHDLEMVREGVTIGVSNVIMDAQSISADLVVTNTGTGHYFPTYVTPWVYLEAYQVDASGSVLAETFRETVVARHVTVSLDEEVFDTRIAPGDSVVLAYSTFAHSAAAALRFRVRVEPDNFYSRFYEAWLDGGFAQRGRALIELALEESRKTAFVLYESDHPVSVTE